MHLLIKTLSQFTFKTTHVKMSVMILKIKLKNPTCFGRSSDRHQGSFPVPCAITTCQPACFVACDEAGSLTRSKVRELTPDDGRRTDRNRLGF